MYFFNCKVKGIETYSRKIRLTEASCIPEKSCCSLSVGKSSRKKNGNPYSVWKIKASLKSFSALRYSQSYQPFYLNCGHHPVGAKHFRIWCSLLRWVKNNVPNRNTQSYYSKDDPLKKIPTCLHISWCQPTSCKRGSRESLEIFRTKIFVPQPGRKESQQFS